MIYGDFRMFYKAEKSGEKNDLMSLYLQIQIPLLSTLLWVGKKRYGIFNNMFQKMRKNYLKTDGFKHKNSGYRSGLRCFAIGGLFATKHSVIGF
jgi:hypothetical protein